MKRMWGTVVAALTIAGAGACSSSSSAPAGEKSTDYANASASVRMYDGTWPLTVQDGTLHCNTNSGAITYEVGGKTYAVNGTAKTNGAAPIDPIWKANPDLPGTKISIGPLIKVGQALCS